MSGATRGDMAWHRSLNAARVNLKCRLHSSSVNYNNPLSETPPTWPLPHSQTLQMNSVIRCLRLLFSIVEATAGD